MTLSDLTSFFFNLKNHQTKHHHLKKPNTYHGYLYPIYLLTYLGCFKLGVVLNFSENKSFTVFVTP